MASEEAPPRQILIYGVQEENGSHVQNFALDLTPPPEVVYKSEPDTIDGMNVLGIVIFSATMGMCSRPLPGSGREPVPFCIYPSLQPVSTSPRNLESPIFRAVLPFLSRGVAQVPIPLPTGVSSPPPKLELAFFTCSSPSPGDSLLSLKEGRASGFLPAARSVFLRSGDARAGSGEVTIKNRKNLQIYRVSVITVSSKPSFLSSISNHRGLPTGHLCPQTSLFLRAHSGLL